MYDVQNKSAKNTAAESFETINSLWGIRKLNFIKTLEIEETTREERLHKRIYLFQLILRF